MERVLCETPATGRKAVRIDRWKYDFVAEAILSAVPDTEPGLFFKGLPTQVAKYLPEDKPIGSVGWYTTTVKLSLEVKGKLRRLAGVWPQRLVKVL
ncbi:DUF6958 family protein [Gilvimarinus algae]|uniref:Uncharacterized protein n=1 Tax=Gilvimarinus algae TaxID=3058037 RepID=A0ABT8TID8_9GAMM|nr:hypothetical protein [Gilvimarinus sp. SDUM040014]MDO3383864.1 hypothetical protein [Gilvimarinus sp. SDUM040014]